MTKMEKMERRAKLMENLKYVYNISRTAQANATVHETCLLAAQQIETFINEMLLVPSKTAVSTKPKED